jgi:hypothetical protein
VLVLVVVLGTAAWAWGGKKAPLVVASHLVTYIRMLAYRYQGKKSGIHLRKLDE